MSAMMNIYCDESCHLENDGKKVMVLGAIYCNQLYVRKHFEAIREIKKRHNLSPYVEIKWTKISPSKVDFYLELVRYFFNQETLNFRGYVADKTHLKHGDFSQSHDEWYFKIYFRMLEILVTHPGFKYNIYLDIKDTCSACRLQKLREILARSIHDFENNIVNKLQAVRSHEVELVQLTDLIIGAISYRARQLKENSAKNAIIDEIEKLSGKKLNLSTPKEELKLNIFHWSGNERI